MSHASKSKAKGVSASSFFDLKAELAKQDDEFVRNKAAGKKTVLDGGLKRADKKPTVWARQNKGVNARASRDIELEAISKPTLESARAALERKAKIYDKLKRGKTGGLSDKQYDALLVDFDLKSVSESYESDSDDVDESLSVPNAPVNEEEDPIVEYEDEFGRIRTGRRSEIPRDLMPHPEDNEPDEDEDIIIRNPVNHFPIYEPSAERIAEIEKAHAEENNPLNIHYNASQEVRAKGAGFYQFSGDEETRRRQMEELKASREETERTRKETGAVDIRPGVAEGMTDEASDAQNTKSRAMEKRKRDLEERRKMIDAKRRKLKTGASSKASVASSSTTTITAKALESVVSPVEDPFAALESKATPALNVTVKGKGKARPTNDADSFLQQLEQELLASKTKPSR